MPSFDVDTRAIYVFDTGDEYIFKQYFEEQDLFEKLQDWYNSEEYRFEIPPEEFDEVAEILENYYYEPTLVDEIDEFCVVKDQYTEHAEILRNSVAHWQRQGYNFFLMKDPTSVDQAIENGATPVEDTDLKAGI
jgi:hypothetical protein